MRNISALCSKKLNDNEFYLQEEKVQLYASELDCLGHMIWERHSHCRGKNAHSKGLVYAQILQQRAMIPWTGAVYCPLPTRSGQLHWSTCSNDCQWQSFQWRPIHQKAFEEIKYLCSKTPVLKPIDPNKDDPIWVICDASASGLGAMYGQGPTWDTHRPTGFMLKNFTAAQCNY